MSNGASIVFEHAAARPEASVFLRPSVMADDEVVAVCCTVDLDADTVASFVLAHPPPLGINTFDDDALIGEMMESFACEISTEKKKRYNADSSATLLEETVCLDFVIVRAQIAVASVSPCSLSCHYVPDIMTMNTHYVVAFAVILCQKKCCAARRAESDGEPLKSKRDRPITGVKVLFAS